MTIESLDFDLVNLSEEVISLLQPSCAAKNVSIRAVSEPGIPRFLRGDSVRIRQILLNLTGNAVKFTERGVVTVRMIPVQVDDTVSRIRVEVHDTGIGIPKNRQAAIFESFTQVDGSTTRRFGGTGLGTTISKQLVELMHGQIGLTSEENVGSVFWFEIPFGAVVGCERVGSEGLCIELTPDASPLTRMEPIIESSEDAPTADGPLILVAEDNSVNLMVARKMLQKLGARVETAANGLEALESIKAHRYELVLMDVQMPKMGGLEATTQVRQWEESEARPRTTIVALTANAMDDDRGMCIDAGMDDFLSKPVRKQDLEALLTKWVKKTPVADAA